MLLFNQKYDTDIQVHFNFNTSNVTIQPSPTSLSTDITDISIHLMLLFNIAAYEDLREPLVFQYI